MIEVNNLSKSFKNRKILDNVSFRITNDQCIGLLGPNGAGKTTLIKCMTGILDYEKGEVNFEGEPISSRKKDIGYLSQHTDFKPWMSCKESLSFFGRLSGLSEQYLQENISDTLSEVGLRGKEKVKVEQLSGGMKQRLGIAQAILHRPSFLILDEPVSALDPIGRNEIKNLIKRLKKYTTIMLSTHILDDASEFCDAYFILKDGKMIGNISSKDEHIDFNQILCEIKTSRPIPEDFILFTHYSIKTIRPDKFHIISDHPIEIIEIVHAFHNIGCNIISIEYLKRNLENIFLDMVSET